MTARPARRTLVALAVLVMVGTSHGPALATVSSLCKAAVDARDVQRARPLCEAAAAQSGEARDQMRLGYVYLLVDDLAAAEQLAGVLIAGPRPGDGYRLRSQVLERREDNVPAYDAATQAYRAHWAAGEGVQVMHDALSVTRLAWTLGDLTTAQEVAEHAVQLARLIRFAGVAGHDGVEVAALIALADALRLLGDHAEAARALDEAIARAVAPCDQGWSRFKRGMLHADQEQPTQALILLEEARQAFGRAADAGQVCRTSLDADVDASIRLNMVRLRLEKDRDAAEARLDLDAAEALLDEIVAAAGESVETHFLRGLVAGNRGDRHAADRHLAAAERDDPFDADWLWEILCARAEVAELRGHPLGDLMAEGFYRRSIAHVRALHASAQAQAAFVIASHRAPYDGLIALLARQGRWRDVIAVVLELDAGDMLRATARVAHDRVPAAATPSVPAPARMMPSVEAVVAAWRGRDLVIVIAPAKRQIRPGDERVVRVRVVGGEVTGETLGSAVTARQDADKLFGDRDNARAAQAMGALIVPADARPETLDVLAIGVLGKVPLAALRDPSGELILARRPLARVLSIHPRDALPPPTAREVVIADPLGDLPAAREEGDVVVAQLGASAMRLGAGAAPATHAGLAEARGARLLHVAAHVAEGGRWRTLRLADGDVAPTELLELRPHLAVLASCGSGAARDHEGWGSIAAALLASGTAAVIATDRSVDDAAALALVREFYAQPAWRDDPARALAQAQIALARGGGMSTWAAFGILRGPPAVVP